MDGSCGWMAAAEIGEKKCRRGVLRKVTGGAGSFGAAKHFGIRGTWFRLLRDNNFPYRSNVGTSGYSKGIGGTRVYCLCQI